MKIIPPSEITGDDYIKLKPALDLSEEPLEKLQDALEIIDRAQMWCEDSEDGWVRMITIIDYPYLHVWAFSGHGLRKSGKRIKDTLLEFCKVRGLKGVTGRMSQRNLTLYSRWVGPPDKVDQFPTWRIKDA